MGFINNNKKILFGSLDSVSSFFGEDRVNAISRLKNKVLTLALTGLGFIGTTSFCVSETNAAPDPLFSPILQDIQDRLPILKGMNIRLPSTFPNAPNGLSGYRPEIYTDPKNGYFAIIFAVSSCPQPVTGMCDTGRIFSAKKGTSTETLFRQTQQQGISINLTRQVSGYYRSYRSSTRGGMEEVMWEQDGLIYGVMSRSMSKSEVISVAKSMANERLIYDSKNTTFSVPVSSPSQVQFNR